MVEIAYATGGVSALIQVMDKSAFANVVGDTLTECRPHSEQTNAEAANMLQIPQNQMNVSLSVNRRPKGGDVKDMTQREESEQPSLKRASLYPNQQVEPQDIPADSKKDVGEMTERGDIERDSHLNSMERGSSIPELVDEEEQKRGEVSNGENEEGDESPTMFRMDTPPPPPDLLSVNFHETLNAYSSLLSKPAPSYPQMTHDHYQQQQQQQQLQLQQQAQCPPHVLQSSMQIHQVLNQNTPIHLPLHPNPKVAFDSSTVPKTPLSTSPYYAHSTLLIPPKAGVTNTMLVVPPVQSPQHPNLATISPSDVRAHSKAVPAPPLPILYSAIGSLERYGTHGSYGKGNERMLEGKRTAMKTPPLLAGGFLLGKPNAGGDDSVQKYLLYPPKNTQTVKTESATVEKPMKLTDGLEEKGGLKHKEDSHQIIKNNSKMQVEGGEVKQRQLNTPIKSTKETSKPIKNPHQDPIPTPQPIEVFTPASEAYTPRTFTDRQGQPIPYRTPELRTPLQTISTSMGSISRPNFRDALRRVAMILHQHIVKIERRFEKVQERGGGGGGSCLFSPAMRKAFAEDRYAMPRFKCSMVRVPMASSGVVCGMRRIRTRCIVPSVEEIYEFAHRLFGTVQLSSECSIVCLIYVERIMEVAKVPLLSDTWRPVFMCGLLLASKVWQDLSSWNVEFANVYPQFSLDSINRLELQYLKMVKWDLYISSTLYAKYYFALRSLLEKKDFRQRYNRMVGLVGAVNVTEALKIQKGSERVKDDFVAEMSRSM